MKQILVVLTMLAFSFSINAQNIARGGDCLKYQPPVLGQIGVSEILVQDGYDEVIFTPAVFETRTEVVQVSPPTTTSDPNCPTCVVDVPATTKTITSRVKVQDEQWQIITHRPKYEKVPIFGVISDGRFVMTHRGECSTSTSSPSTSVSLNVSDEEAERLRQQLGKSTPKND